MGRCDVNEPCVVYIIAGTECAGRLYFYDELYKRNSDCDRSFTICLTHAHSY